MQYSLNFLVYAAQSRPYRKAYGYFLNDIKEKESLYIHNYFSIWQYPTYFYDRSNQNSFYLLKLSSELQTGLLESLELLYLSGLDSPYSSQSL